MLLSFSQRLPLQLASAPRAALRFALRAQSGLKPRPNSFWSRLTALHLRCHDSVNVWGEKQKAGRLDDPRKIHRLILLGRSRSKRS